MLFQKLQGWLSGIVLCQVVLSSCVGTERSNPLDTTSFELFIPQVSRPVGGEEMFPGTAQEIRWRPAAKVLDATVTIQLVCEDDTSTIIHDTLNDGTFAWIVPDTPSSDCRIRIVGIGGASISPGAFRIRKPPVEARIDLGGLEDRLDLEDEGPRHPTALRKELIFTAKSPDGNTDLWYLDRTPDLVPAPTRITSNPEFDGQAAWFKPNGRVIAYTAEDGNGQRDVWIRATEGQFGPQTTRISQGGGEEPAWRNMPASGTFSQPALVYKKPVGQGLSLPEKLSALETANLDIDISGLPNFVLPFGLSRPPVELPLHNGLLEAALDNVYWFSDGSSNYVLYGGNNPDRIYTIDFFDEVYETATNIAYGLPPGLVPMRPAISPDGRFVAFSSQGDIWIAPISGVVAWRATLGIEIDDYPDWATEDEIVFQRKTSPGAQWRLWTVQRPDDVP